MARVWCIWSGKSENATRNLRFGRATSTWGLINTPVGGTPTRGDFVLFGMNSSSGNARLQWDAWAATTATLLLGEVTTDLYLGTAPHWPDEATAAGNNPGNPAAAIVYPHRFGFVPLAEANQVDLGPSGPLDAKTSDQLRTSVGGNRAYLSPNADLTRLAARLGIGISAATGRANLGQINLPVEDADVDDDVSAFAGPGRSSDPELRAAVEAHAVRLATEHMKTAHGWTGVTPLGKPFDLVCTGPNGEKHVEVKGTTGAGGMVEYTTNEVDHFRNCPHGADLVVVREIQVDRTTRPYTTSGGELHHIEDYTAPADDLQPTKYNGRVPR